MLKESHPLSALNLTTVRLNTNANGYFVSGILLHRKTNTKVIIYFGVSGHGKRLVDAMSRFGVKGPLMRAVITQDLHYQCAKDIHNYLSNNF